MKIMKKILLLFYIVILSLFKFFYAIGEPLSPALNQPVDSAGKENRQKVLSFIGNVTSEQSSVLLWNTEGLIEDVNVELGEKINTGDVLASLSVNSLDSNVINAEIPWLTSLDQLDDIVNSESGKMEAYKELAERQVDYIHAQSFLISLDYPRATDNEKAYWEKQVDIYKAEYDKALQSLNDAASWKHSTDTNLTGIYTQRKECMLESLSLYAEAYNNYLYYRGDATENDKTLAQANVNVAYAEYEKALFFYNNYESDEHEKKIAALQLEADNAMKTYNYRYIISNINGIVTKLSVRPGDYVRKGDVAVRVDDMNHLYIPINIPEVDLFEVYEGMSADIILDANRGKTYHGILNSISSSGVTKDNLMIYDASVELLDPDDQIKIGMTAEVRLIVDDNKSNAYNKAEK